MIPGRESDFTVSHPILAKKLPVRVRRAKRAGAGAEKFSGSDSAALDPT